MRGMNKLGRILDGIIGGLFGALMVAVLLATVVLDKSVILPYPNTVLLANGAYYLAALLLLWVLVRALAREPGPGGRRGAISPRKYHIALAAMAIIVAALQFFVARWMPSPHDVFKTDFKNVMDGARAIASGGSLEKFTYFTHSPNNLNVTIALSFVYRVLRSEWAMVWFGALMVNASMVLTSLLVCRLTRREGLALAVAGVGEVLVGLTWRAFLLYTDNVAMILVLLMLWLYTTKLRTEVKTPLILLVGALSCFIKVTNVIVIVALAIAGLVRWLRREDRGVNLRSMALCAVCFALLFGGLLKLQGPIRSHYGFAPGEYPKGWQYMFMVGQNDKGLGAVGGNNKKLRDNTIAKYADLKLINEAFLKRGLNFIRNRGIGGNVVFYAKKLTHVFNDGYFHNVQNEKIYDMERGGLYEWYIQKGRYYQFGATLFQVLWDMVLLAMMLSVGLKALSLWRRRRGEIPPRTRAESTADIRRVIKLTILGIVLYLMMLEGRSKYLYMFLPVFITAFGLALDDLSLALREAKACLSAGREARAGSEGDRA